MRIDGFDWDEGNRDKCRKHGVSLSEIEEAFAGMPRIAPDPAHSMKEQRFRAVGVTAKGRHVFAVFTVRRKAAELLIRVISARYMHKKEIEAYEKAVSDF